MRHSLKNLLQKFVPNGKTRPVSRPARPRCQLGVEVLECREVPAVLGIASSSLPLGISSPPVPVSALVGNPPITVPFVPNMSGKCISLTDGNAHGGTLQITTENPDGTFTGTFGNSDQLLLRNNANSINVIGTIDRSQHSVSGLTGYFLASIHFYGTYQDTGNLNTQYSTQVVFDGGISVNTQGVVSAKGFMTIDSIVTDAFGNILQEHHFHHGLVAGVFALMC
jgi:hypothetical protein